MLSPGRAVANGLASLRLIAEEAAGSWLLCSIEEAKARCREVFALAALGVRFNPVISGPELPREAGRRDVYPQRIPSSINFTKPPIVCGVTTPAPVFSVKPGILYLLVSTHCRTGMKPCRYSN